MIRVGKRKKLGAQTARMLGDLIDQPIKHITFLHFPAVSILVPGSKRIVADFVAAVATHWFIPFQIGFVKRYYKENFDMTVLGASASFAQLLSSSCCVCCSMARSSLRSLFVIAITSAVRCSISVMIRMESRL